MNKVLNLCCVLWPPNQVILFTLLVRMFAMKLNFVEWFWAYLACGEDFFMQSWGDACIAMSFFFVALCTLGDCCEQRKPFKHQKTQENSSSYH